MIGYHDGQGGGVRTFVANALLGFLLVAAPIAIAAPAGAEIGPRIDVLMAKWDRKDSPGVIVAVAKDGQTLHARGYGMANLEHGVPLTPDTITESGSVAKQFTAAAVVLLDVRGQLSLDDPIQKHLPEMKAFGHPITLRQILNHTSGLRDIHGLFALKGRPSYSSYHDHREVLELLSQQRDLNFEPGTEYLYSNAGWILLTIVVERASGKSFTRFCHDEIFGPLGMKHTSWRDDFKRVVPGRATGYAPRPGGGFEIDLPYSNLHGNGGLLTTVGDQLRWTASLDRTDGEWGQMVKKLQTRSRLKNGREISYALGLSIGEFRGVREISHGGSTAGFRTFLTRFPDRNVAIAVFGNSADLDGGNLAHRIAEVVLDLRPAPARRPARVALPTGELAGYAGLYRNATADELVTLTMEEGKLMNRRVELVPLGGGKFAAGANTTVVFGEGRRLTVDASGEVSTYEPVAKAKPTAEQMGELIGNYHSRELDVVVPVTLQQGRLMVRIQPTPATKLEPTFVDGFTAAGWGHFTFTRDSGGRVTGFEFTNGRCRRIKFERR